MLYLKSISILIFLLLCTNLSGQTPSKIKDNTKSKVGNVEDETKSQVGSKQLFIGLGNVGSQDVTHTISVRGTYWEYDMENEYWSISSDLKGTGSSVITHGNSNFNHLGNWNGWNFFWLNNTATGDSEWALGLYKVTNSYNSNYFYIDCRVDAFGENGTGYNPPDFAVYLNGTDGKYNYTNDVTSWPTWTAIENNGDVVRIWDIKEVNPPISTTLPNFWEHCLIITEFGDNLKLIWSVYPGEAIQNYNIYRYNGSKWNLFETVSSNTLDRSISFGGAQYFVKAVIIEQPGVTYESGPTNIVGWNPKNENKSGHNFNELEKNIVLNNYPNPFNPTTTIYYSVGSTQFVELKVYDILGSEVTTLINEKKPAGEYEVEFRAENLPSGVYIYRLTAGDFSESKKLLLMK